MSFRFSLIHVAARAALPQCTASTFLPRVATQPLALFKPQPQYTTSPSMIGQEYLANYNRSISNSLYELCAVPKKRTSPRRKKVRAHGNWQRNAHMIYKRYQICLECRRAMLPSQVCTINKNCMSQPRF